MAYGRRRATTSSVHPTCGTDQRQRAAEASLAPGRDQQHLAVARDHRPRRHSHQQAVIQGQQSVALGQRRASPFRRGRRRAPSPTAGERIVDYETELLGQRHGHRRDRGLADDEWSLAWQSAGRTPDPWQGPDILEVIADLADDDTTDGVLVCPQGFTSDHLEVLYDLDVQARSAAEAAGLAFARTPSVNDDAAVCAGLAARVLALALATPT